MNFLGKFAATVLSSAIAVSSINAVSPASALTADCTLRPARSASVGSEVFLGGDFIELGLSAVGSFGTSGFTPSGFRGNAIDRRIGMTADLDGFCATPSDNVDMPIDFFMPGSEEERWSVGFTLSGVQHFGSFSEINGDNSSAGILATHVVTDESSGDDLQARVVSTISLNGSDVLRVTAVHSFEKSDAFYDTSVVFQNLSGSELTDVRYHRSFDPDNAVFQNGGYTTQQTILATIDNDGYSAVQAKLRSYDLTSLSASGALLYELQSVSELETEIPVVFFSFEEQSVAYFGGFRNIDPYEPLMNEDRDSTDFFDSPQAVGSGEERDRGMGIIVRTLSLAAGLSSDPLTYTTSLDPRDFDEVLQEVVPASEADTAPELLDPTNFVRLDSYSVTRSPTGALSLRLEGLRLWCVSALLIDGQKFTFQSGFSSPWYEYLTVDVTGITPGTKSLILESCAGTSSYVNWVKIPNPLAPKSMWVKLSSETLNADTRARIGLFLSKIKDDYSRIRCIVNSTYGAESNEKLALEICSFAQSKYPNATESFTQSKDSFEGTGYWVNIWLSDN